MTLHLLSLLYLFNFLMPRLSFNRPLSKGPVAVDGKFQGSETLPFLCNKCNVCHYLRLTLSSSASTYFHATNLLACFSFVFNSPP